jgi:hypothetical protein
MRVPSAVRIHWRAMLMLAGGVLTAAGIILSSGVTFLAGLLILLLTLLIPLDSPAVSVDLALMPFLVDARRTAWRLGEPSRRQAQGPDVS